MGGLFQLNGGKPHDAASAMTETMLRQAALAAVTNAKLLYDSAEVLMKKHNKPPATALAVVGLEEFGKALAFAIAAAVPAQRDVLKERMNDLRDHYVKHFVAIRTSAAEADNTESWSATEEELGWKPPAEMRCRHMLRSLATWGLTDVIAPRTEAREFWDGVEFGMHDSPTLSDPNRLKQAALYVDLTDDGQLLTPERVIDQAEAQISELSYFLDEFAFLTQALADDTKWEELKAFMKRGPWIQWST